MFPTPWQIVCNVLQNNISIYCTNTPPCAVTQISGECVQHDKRKCTRQTQDSRIVDAVWRIDAKTRDGGYAASKVGVCRLAPAAGRSFVVVVVLVAFDVNSAHVRWQVTRSRESNDGHCYCYLCCNTCQHGIAATEADDATQSSNWFEYPVRSITSECNNHH